MPIKYKLIFSFLAVSLFIGALAGLNYIYDVAMAGRIAQHEAISIARTIAFDITAHEGEGDSLRFKEASELQAHIMQFKSLQGRDIVVVDTGQRIIADAIPAEIGTIFNHDKNNEVGQSIKDGQIRTFEEISPAYPEGIKSLVIPLDSDEGIRMGAVILEYTPLYLEIIGHARNQALKFLFYFLAAVLGAGAVGYAISRNISRPLKEIKNAAIKIAGGDLDARVEYRSKDELGVLAESFNAMADRVKKARNELQETNKKLQLDIRRREQAEKELKASEEKFRNLFESATDAIFVIDLDGNFLDINRIAYERLGYTKDEMLSMHITQLDPPEFATKVAERQARIQEHGSAVFESVHLRKDGSVMPVEVNSRLMDYEGKKVYFSVIRDLTDRIKATNELQESEAKLRSIIESSPVAIAYGNVDSLSDLNKAVQQVDYNEEFTRWLGYSKDEFRRLGVIGVTHPEDINKELALLQEMVEGKRNAYRIEKRYFTKDGTVVWGDLTVSLVRNISGGRQFLVVMIMDITERKEAEKELRASEEKFRNLFESATDAIFVLDLDGNFLDVNRTAYERLGYTREELMSMRKIYRLHPPEFTARFPKQMENLKRHGGAVFEWAHVKKDGTVMPVEVNVRIIDFEGQKAMISIVRDITERKEAEEIIKASLREKELLLREIHHRVKNNMAVIIAILSLQARKIKDEEYRTAFVESSDRIRTMALIHEMLYRGGDLGRIDFNGYVRELANNLLASHRGLAPNITFKRDIRDVSLGIDAAIPCGLILNELIINSLKHAFPHRRGGNITVCMGRDNGEIVLSVQDDGIGLSGETDIAKSETLGVQIIHSLVTQLDGKIEVDATNGTKYSIRFRELTVMEKS